MKLSFGCLPPASLGLCLVFSLLNTASAQISTLAATGITTTNGKVTLNAVANTDGHPTLVYFKYGLGAALNLATAVTNIGAVGTAVAVSVPIVGIVGATNYSYQAVATNDLGNHLGSVFTFSTPWYPGTVSAPVITNGVFQVNVLGTTNARYGLYISSNLVDWSLIPPQFTWFSPTPVPLAVPPAVTNTGHWFYLLR